ncbi:sporulation histidine kinase inhibitor Sda [Paenibacillus sp. BSR1-1]|uniref:sporulation histidine kinase inhibitor Sda n=1 Tax=Paenibacillus sp. BSR1-1 TaxID=3020845 RepID=UPI0025B1A3C7|nr:sporulation histidine kinase inhibitor Sda [Paenibacillus sp. BSR1-1]MDN3015684.1 sporulation histidine kinase inhibitor Sda [Paenibacillus sp. BSR1-1]
MDYAWFYVEDELLLKIYRKAIDQQLGMDFTGFVYKEISRRKIPPREYLKRIK